MSEARFTCSSTKTRLPRREASCRLALRVGTWAPGRSHFVAGSQLPLTVPAAQQLLCSRARITEKFALCRNRFHFSGIECEKNQGGGGGETHSA